MRILIVIMVSSIRNIFLFRSRIILGVFVDFLKVKCYNNAAVMTVFCQRSWL